MIARLSRRFTPRQKQTRVQLVFLSALSLLFVLYAALQTQGMLLASEMLMGCILSLTSAFLGYVFIERAFHLNHRLFIIISLAGMTLRFFLMILSIAAILLVAAVHVGGFIGSFMVTYTAVLFAEVYYLNWKTDQLKAANIPVRTR